MTQQPDVTFVDSWSSVKGITCHIHYSLTDSVAQSNITPLCFAVVIATKPMHAV